MTNLSASSSSKRRQAVGIGSWLIATLLVGVILVLLSQLPAVKTFIEWAPAPERCRPRPRKRLWSTFRRSPRILADLPGPCSASGRRAGEAEGRKAGGRDARGRQAGGRATAPEPWSPRAPARREHPDPKQRPSQSSPCHRRPRRGGDVVSPRLAGLPRVDLVRNPAAASRGGSRLTSRGISDAAGQLLAGAEVSLVGSMEDGTVFDAPLEPGPEPGTLPRTGAARPFSPCRSAAPRAHERQTSRDPFEAVMVTESVYDASATRKGYPSRSFRLQLQVVVLTNEEREWGHELARARSHSPAWRSCQIASTEGVVAIS